jgi:cytochrome P450
MWFPSGNRDDDAFIEPFRFDINRADNPHVAFGGGGAHFCLGASLARRELATIFRVLLDRCQDIQLTGPPEYAFLGIDNPILLFVRELPACIR